MRSLVGAVLVLAMLMPLFAVRADEALPTLPRFLRAGRERAPDNRVARANASQQGAEHDRAVATLLPRLSASAGYTRNQYEVAASFPREDGSLQTATITPNDQLDATLTLDATVFDLRAFRALDAAGELQDASESLVEASERRTDLAVTQAYYQRVAGEALDRAAQRAIEASEQNLEVVRVRVESGLASALDVARARAEVARNQRALSEAELATSRASRRLFTLTGIEASGSAPELSPASGPAAPLATWLGRVEGLPEVRAARSELGAAEATEDASWAAFVPRVYASATERFTNAVAFGFSPEWSFGVRAEWALDLASESEARARGAATESARIDLLRVIRDAHDAVEDRYAEVASFRAGAAAAVAELEASTQAAEVARARYRAGTGTQLEVVQADRAALDAEVAVVSTGADLAFARAALRIVAGSDALEEASP